ncbi:50S ribosomal protein L6 [Geodia barretti]|uniref:Large ribosomal subunit protein uL6 n=1 Tax=Geodia barretti TaxID=519541 RepID=A0AA35WWR9_GEOBA|nr:50S ribosomal protein L6 [Geodia barretti]
MSVTDPVADMLTKIRNAGMAGHESVDIVPSKFKLEIVKTLKTEGYLRNFKRVGQDGQGPVRVFLKYDDERRPVIRGVQRLSKPGRRVYRSYRDMPAILNGYGIIPIPVPAGVDVAVQDSRVDVAGPKGTLSRPLPATVRVEVADGKVAVSRTDEERSSRAIHGLTRNLIANMVTGVSAGFTRELLISGVGYRAEVQGQALVVDARYSNPVQMQIPADLTVQVAGGNRILISGIDKQTVGQFAADVRSVRPPEPYKGKGIRYADEHVRRKVGKSAVGGTD